MGKIDNNVIVTYKNEYEIETLKSLWNKTPKDYYLETSDVQAFVYTSITLKRSCFPLSISSFNIQYFLRTTKYN